LREKRRVALRCADTPVICGLLLQRDIYILAQAAFCTVVTAGRLCFCQKLHLGHATCPYRSFWQNSAPELGDAVRRNCGNEVLLAGKRWNFGLIYFALSEP